jgi:hypothetical protein
MMRACFPTLPCLAAVVWLATAVPAHALTNLTGDLIVEAQRLENFSRIHFGENSNNYVAPAPVEWADFKTLAQSLWVGDTNAADTQATALGYELFTFTDTNYNLFLYGVRSVETNNLPVKGWGTYFVNTNSAVPALIQAPHPQWDFRSPLLAAEVFLKSGARGLMIAGAHRHVNGNSTGDPADLTNTIFHAVHEQWSGPNATNLAWQIHGFNPANHPGFPPGTLAVLSTGKDGDNHFSTNLVRLDQRFEWNDIKSYGYAKNLPVDHPLNLLVNEGVDGQTFVNLGARSNVQGDYCHAAGGDFLHIEMATFTRTNTPTRARVADAIACAVLLSRTNAPPPQGAYLLTNPRATAEGFAFDSPTVPHRAYRVDQSSGLDQPAWEPCCAFPGRGQLQSLTNTNALPAPRFFRAISE